MYNTESDDSRSHDFPIHIEITGVPGAGKSTIVRKLESKNTNVYRRDTAYEIALLRSIFGPHWARHKRLVPSSAIRGLAQLVGRSPHSLEHLNPELSEFHETTMDLLENYTESPLRRNHVRATISYLVTEYQLITRHLRLNEIVCFDEGFFQRGISIFCPPDPSKSIDDKDLQLLLSVIPEPDAIILLNVSPETAEQRLRTRSDGYPDSYSDFSRKAMLEVLERTDEFLSLLSDGVESIPLLHLDNHASIEESIDQIQMFLIEQDILPYEPR